VEGLKRFNAAQRRPWEDPNPPSDFRPAPQSYVERPLETNPVRETVEVHSPTSRTYHVEIEDDAPEWGFPDDGRS
jgi:hypothetical protein